MDRQDLEFVCTDPRHEAIRDAFEREFGDAIYMDPAEYVVWLERRVIASEKTGRP